jgi:hypothetical protein
MATGVLLPLLLLLLGDVITARTKMNVFALKTVHKRSTPLKVRYGSCKVVASKTKTMMMCCV